MERFVYTSSLKPISDLGPRRVFHRGVQLRDGAKVLSARARDGRRQRQSPGSLRVSSPRSKLTFKSNKI